MNVRSVLRECMTDLLDTEPNTTVEHIVRCAYKNNPDVFADRAEEMMLDSARALVRAMLRETSEDDDQLTFVGVGLPSTICVQTPDGTYYVRSDKARWHELQAGRNLRFDNVTSAQRKLDAYEAVLEDLRPLMEHNETLTVADAVARLGLERAS